MSKTLQVALLYNARPSEVRADLPDDTYEEFDGAETIAKIAAAIEGLGVAVTPVLADRRLPWRLEEGRFDVAFNIAEGEGRRCREAVPAAVCELLGLPYTGSDPLTLAVTLDKAVARRVVSPEVPVARGVLVETDADLDALGTLAYPVLVKPNDEGSSKGIRDNPVAADPAAAAARVRWLRDTYGCPALVEEFLPGAEVTVGVAGNGRDARVIGRMEIAPADLDEAFVYSLEVKRDWQRRVRYHVPPRFDAATLAELDRLALTAYRLLGCRDLSRMDFRLDAAGRPRFIECNPLPGLNPETGDVVLLSRPTLPYDRLVQGVLEAALLRLAGSPAGVRERFGITLP
ncbi:MAG: D-alanine--D-alanine ligase [Myxococcota bacterium]